MSEVVRSELVKQCAHYLQALNPQQLTVFRKFNEMLDKPKTASQRSRVVWLNGTLPGTGKTFLGQAFLKYFEVCKYPVIVLAPTAQATIPLKGRTTYKFCGLKPGHGYTNILEYFQHFQREELAASREEIKHAKLLVFDEVGLEDVELIDAIEKWCRSLRKSSALFGGILVLLIGDPFQINRTTRGINSSLKVEDDWKGVSCLPVDKGGLEGGAAPSFFTSSLFSTWCPLEMQWVLTENMRQKNDLSFCELLGRARIAELSEEDQKALRNTVQAVPTWHKFHGVDEKQLRDYILSATELARYPTHLFSLRKDVEDWNAQRVEELPSGLTVWYRREHLRSERENPELVFRKYAPVLLTRTLNEEKGLKSGCLGHIIDIQPVSQTDKRACLVVRFGDYLERVLPSDKGQVLCYDEALQPAGLTVKSQRHTFANQSIRHSATIPLELAFAMTVDQSQGKTLSKVFISLQGMTQDNAFLVALSRVKNLADLTLVSWNPQACKVSPWAIAWWKKWCNYHQRDLQGHPLQPASTNSTVLPKRRKLDLKKKET